MAEVVVTQEDREAAASAYFAWISSNPVMPQKMRSGAVDDHSMVQAFARHRIAAEQRGFERAKAQAKVITEEHPDAPGCIGGRDLVRNIATAISNMETSRGE